MLTAPRGQLNGGLNRAVKKHRYKRELQCRNHDLQPPYGNSGTAEQGPGNHPPGESFFQKKSAAELNKDSGEGGNGVGPGEGDGFQHFPVEKGGAEHQQKSQGGAPFYKAEGKPQQTLPGNP